jgi:integrase
LLERDAIPLLGNVRMSDFRGPHLDRLAKRVAARKGVKGAEHVSANTVRLALAPVKALLADAAQRGDIVRNPALGWKTRYTQTSDEVAEDDDGTTIDEPVKALSDTELAALLPHLPDQWRFFFEFLAQTGLRISEASELRWRDVDLGRKRFEVRRRFYRGTIAPPKSRCGRRKIRLTDATAQRLWTIQGDPNELVFTMSSGKRINQQNLQRRVLTPAAAAAGLGTVVKTKDGKRVESWVTFHTFRHTCASLLFREGWNAKQVQMWLGHHSPAFTLSAYVHLLPDDLPDPSFFDVIGGNAGATYPTETDRDTGPAQGAETALVLGTTRAS